MSDPARLSTIQSGIFNTGFTPTIIKIEKGFCKTNDQAQPDAGFGRIQNANPQFSNDFYVHPACYPIAYNPNLTTISGWIKQGRDYNDWGEYVFVNPGNGTLSLEPNLPGTQKAQVQQIWRDFKNDNGIDPLSKPTRLFITMCTKKAFVDNNITLPIGYDSSTPDDTFVWGMTYLSCNRVVSDLDWNPKLRRVNYFDSNFQYDIYNFYGSAQVRLDGTDEVVSIAKDSVTGQVEGVVTMIVDVNLPNYIQMCSIPRNFVDCKPSPVAPFEIPEICFPSNTSGSTTITDGCRFYLNNASPGEYDTWVQGVCGLYPETEACTCTNADQLPEFQALQSLPTFAQSRKGCFWQPCKNTDGTIFVLSVDKEADCANNYCINSLDISGDLDEVQLENLKQNLTCFTIDDKDDGGGGSGGGGGGDDDKVDTDLTPFIIGGAIGGTVLLIIGALIAYRASKQKPEK